MSKEQGWVSLNRGIRGHWLYQEKRVFSRYEAWIDILMDANHADNKFLMNGELVQVNRGEFITSIRKLGERWDWSRTKVKSFLELLESDGMATVKSDTKKTVITIANYDVYQSNDLEKRRKKASEEPQKRHGSATERHQKDTNNNVNNANNNNNANKSFDSPPATFTNNNINVYEKVEREFGRFLSPIESETITAWIHDDQYNPELIQLALKEAVLNQARSLKYIDKILLDWERDGVKSKHQALDRINKRAEGRKSVTGPQEVPEELPTIPLYNWMEPEQERVT